MRRLVTSRLIRIYTVCNSVIDFWLKPLLATMGVSKFRDGRIPFRNSRLKELKCSLHYQERFKLDLDVRHQGQGFQWVCLNDKPRLTFDRLTASSDYGTRVNLGCFQKCKEIGMFIPAPNDERQQDQGSYPPAYAFYLLPKTFWAIVSKEKW